MTIKAMVPNGIKIIDIFSPKASAIYDGIYVEMKGVVRIDNQWKPSGLSLEMNPSDALDFAIHLVDAVRQNQKQNESRLHQFNRMIEKRMKK